jgi:hypothetical protein
MMIAAFFAVLEVDIVMWIIRMSRGSSAGGMDERRRRIAGIEKVSPVSLAEERERALFRGVRLQRAIEPGLLARGTEQRQKGVSDA